MNGRYGEHDYEERGRRPGGRGGSRPRTHVDDSEREARFAGRRDRDEEEDRHGEREGGGYGREYDDFASRGQRGWTQMGPRGGSGRGERREDEYGGDFDPGGYAYGSAQRGRDFGFEGDLNRRFGVGSTGDFERGGYGREGGGRSAYGGQGGGYYGGQGGFGGQRGFGGQGGGYEGSFGGDPSRGTGRGGEGRFGQYGETGGWPASRGSFAGRGPKGYRRSDERVLEEVNQALEDHPEIDASNIEVECRAGEIVLKGTVDDRRTKRLAESCIEDLSGVKDVRNELRVQTGREGREGAAGGASMSIGTGARSGSHTTGRKGDDKAE